VERGAGLSSDVLQAKSSLAAAKARRVVIEGQLENAKARFRAVFGREVTDEEIAGFQTPDVPYEQIPVTLEEAVLIALRENPQLIMLDKNVVAAREQIDVVDSRFYPNFNLFGEHWRKENDGGNDGVAFETRAGLEFSWNIYRGGGDVAAKQAAISAKEDAIMTLRDTHRTIGEQVRVSWQNLLTAQSKATWFGNQANIENEFLQLARKERKMGNRSLIDVLSAEVNYINALSGTVGAEIDKAVAAYNLLYAMGRLDLELF
jgi:adhesin transport system outer membrane protein